GVFAGWRGYAVPAARAAAAGTVRSTGSLGWLRRRGELMGPAAAGSNFRLMSPGIRRSAADASSFTSPKIPPGCGGAWLAGVHPVAVTSGRPDASDHSVLVDVRFSRPGHGPLMDTHVFGHRRQAELKAPCVDV